MMPKTESSRFQTAPFIRQGFFYFSFPSPGLGMPLLSKPLLRVALRGKYVPKLGLGNEGTRENGEWRHERFGRIRRSYRGKSHKCWGKITQV